MPERDIGPGMRALLGVLGAAAVAAGLAVGTTQLRGLYLGAPLFPGLATAILCVVVVAGGIILLRGAARGRIVVRRTRFRGRSR